MTTESQTCRARGQSYVRHGFGLLCAACLIVTANACRRVLQPTSATPSVASTGQPVTSTQTSTRQPWAEDAELEKVAHECPMLKPVIDKMHEEHFEEAIEIARAITRDTACASRAYDLETSRLMAIGRTWEFTKNLDHSPPGPQQGLDGSHLELWYRRLLEVAQSSSPFRDPARRLLVPKGLNFWVRLAREQCSYLGVVGPCIEAERSILAVAPNSEQAKTVAGVITKESEVDREMTPVYKIARGIIFRRARRCNQINNYGCFAYQHGMPEPEPDPEDEPSKITEDEALDDLLKPSVGCPSWWDKSPATLRINAEWHALLAEIPYKGRRKYLAQQWVYTANRCREGLVIPWEKSITK